VSPPPFKKTASDADPRRAPSFMPGFMNERDLPAQARR
jgi:hypothetical protein